MRPPNERASTLLLHRLLRLGANGGGRTHMAVNRWNLNPVRLPIPPRSHLGNCRHYSGGWLAGVGGGGSGWFSSGGFSAAGAGGCLGWEVAGEGRFYVEAVMGFAFGG